VVSLLIFAAVAYITVVVDEGSERVHESPEEIAREARAEVGHAMLVAGPICLVLAVAGTLLVTRRTLRPLDQVIRAAALITPRELQQRLPVPSSQDEVRDVVLAFNGLLERLERGFDTLDRFAIDASHELRTPLTVMGTELEVMLRSARSSADWEAAGKTCLGEVRRLTRLVEALLDMGRAERTRSVASGAADMQLVIERVLALSRERASERGVYLGTAPGDAPGAALVRGDAASLQSALAGVVDNAIQYTPAGGEVLVWWLIETDGTLTVHVDDSGPGVNADDVERIFEPFMRGAVGRDSSPGFGLGLAIARRICERNGATIHVARSPHGGARFSLTFSAIRAT
jgi:signal transduction histidine kinase